jgi:hypothetical protein
MQHLRKTIPVVLLMLAMTAFSGVVAVSAQDQPQSQSQQAMDNKTATGNLVSVDTSTKMLTIKQPSGEQLQFEYDANTKVEGSQNSVQGLASETGTSVTVYYTESGGKNLASRIEVHKK